MNYLKTLNFLVLFINSIYFSPKIFAQNYYYENSSLLHFSKTSNLENLTSNVDITNVITKKSSSQTVVNVKHEKKGPSNPYKIDFDYFINDLGNDYQLDMIAIIDPMLTRYDKNKYQLKYDGDKIVYPKSIKLNEKINDANGVFTLKISDKIAINYEVSINHNFLKSIEKIVINQIEMTAYVYQFNYNCNVKSNQKCINNQKEKITEWFVPDYGIVKMTRENANNLEVISLK